MGIFKVSKVNKLVSIWPQNSVGINSWLRAQGVSNSLITKYVNSGWLRRLGEGAFYKVGDHPNWMGAVSALQSQMKLPIHVGGETVLSLDGLQDQVPQLEGVPLHLYGPHNSRLPKWLKSKELKVDPQLSQIELFKKEPKQTLRKIEFEFFSIQASSRERAILELLLDVPQKKDIASVFPLFHQLSTLRPKVIQEHLELCNSIKVKRLFLYLARESQMPWYKEINRSKIKLGKGSRMIEKNGKFDSEFQITVPDSLGE